MNAELQTVVNAIRSEIKTQQDSLSEWGLSEQGRKAVLKAHSLFERAMEIDLQLLRQGLDVTESMNNRLENVRDLPGAIRRQLQDAMDAGWLGQWMAQAEDDVESGLSAAIPSPRQTLAN